MEKSKRITALLLAGSMVVGAMPTHTNCGLFSFLKRNKYLFKAVAHYSLAAAAIFAMHATKNPAKQLPHVPKGTGHFYAKNFGKTVLGTLALPKMWKMLTVFGRNSKYKGSSLFAKGLLFTFFGAFPFLMYLQSGLSLICGTDMLLEDEA